MVERVRTAGGAAIVGGVLAAAIPLFDGPYPSYLQAAVVAPFLLLVAIYGVWSYYGVALSRAAVSPLVVGFGMLGIVAVWNIFTADALAATLVLGGAAILGLILVAIGNVLVAHRLQQTGRWPRWAAALFALALPLDPVFNGVVTPLLGGGLSLYGLAWVAIGAHLLRRTPVDNGASDGAVTNAIRTE